MLGKGLEDANQEFVVEEARRTFPSAEKFPLAPSNTPTPLKTRASEAGQCRAARHRQKPSPQERISSGHQAAIWNKGRGHERTNSTGTGKLVFRKTQQGQNHRLCTRSPLPQAARSVMPCLVDQWFEDAGAAVRGRENRGRGGPAVSSSSRISGIHTTGREQEWQYPAVRAPPPLLPGLCPKNAKRPPCGGPCILFPHPAGAGHGHRNYSALSALAGASVLASGRRVSSMMAMGALSPLRGMASFITRV